MIEKERKKENHQSSNQPTFFYFLLSPHCLGYGDIVPTTQNEIILVIIFIFIGVAYFGFVLSTVGALMDSVNSSDPENGAKLVQFQQMESFLKRFSFSGQLQREIRKHFMASSMASPTGRDMAFYRDLPLWLKYHIGMELQRPGLIALLGGQQAWDALSPEVQYSVSRGVVQAAEIESYIPGSKVFTLHDKNDCVYFLDEGEVAMYIPGVMRPVHVCAPAVMGIGAVLNQWPEAAACYHWASSCRASSSCFAWKIEAAVLQKYLMHNSPEVLVMMVQHYIEFLEQTLVSLHEADVSKWFPGLHAVTTNYQKKCNGAKAAAADMEASIKAVKEVIAEERSSRQRREMHAAASRTTTRTAASTSAASLQGISNVSTMTSAAIDKEQAEEEGKEEGRVGNRLHPRRAELQSLHNGETDETDDDDDLERNSIVIGEELEKELDRRQSTLQDMENSESEKRVKAAAGVLRKEGDTTFVV